MGEQASRALVRRNAERGAACVYRAMSDRRLSFSMPAKTRMRASTSVSSGASGAPSRTHSCWSACSAVMRFCGGVWGRNDQKKTRPGET